jgi:hypothetical protein
VLAQAWGWPIIDGLLCAPVDIDPASFRIGLGDPGERNLNSIRSSENGGAGGIRSVGVESVEEQV